MYYCEAGLQFHDSSVAICAGRDQRSCRRPYRYSVCCPSPFSCVSASLSSFPPLNSFHVACSSASVNGDTTAAAAATPETATNGDHPPVDAISSSIQDARDESKVRPQLMHHSTQTFCLSCFLFDGAATMVYSTVCEGSRSCNVASRLCSSRSTRKRERLIFFVNAEVLIISFSFVRTGRRRPPFRCIDSSRRQGSSSFVARCRCSCSRRRSNHASIICC